MNAEILLGLLSGALVSLALGVVGGGGSMLAIPLLVHLVGVRSPHVAIGVSAVSVAAHALMNLFLHAKHNRVKWRCAALFAASGVAGALTGAQLGKAMDGTKLLTLFGVLMMIVGVNMLRAQHGPGNTDVRLTRDSARVLVPRLVGSGVATGVASGFFGIGGGFLITPSLVWATGMPVDFAISTSLVAVSTFGVATAASYAFNGLVDWAIAASFILGGIGGALMSRQAVKALGAHKPLLTTLFALIVIMAGTYLSARGLLNVIG